MKEKMRKSRQLPKEYKFAISYSDIVEIQNLQTGKSLKINMADIPILIEGLKSVRQK